MATDDVQSAYQDLREKNVSFYDFLFGPDGRLTSDSFSEVSLRSIDIRYSTLKKGTKMYRRVKVDSLVMYALNVKTLSTFLSANSEEEPNGMWCISLFELLEDVSVLEIREDVAQEICRMWIENGTESKETENGPEEVADTAPETSDEDLQMKEKYQKLLERTNMKHSNLVDYIFEVLLPDYTGMQGILYSRLDHTYSLLVVKNFMKFKIREHYALRQNFVFPKTSLGNLSSDGEGFLSLLASPQSLTNLDDTDSGKQEETRQGKDPQLELQGKAEAVPSYDDHYPTPEEYNDYTYNGNLDYEDLRIDAPTETGKSLASRPGQPPPPPPGSAAYAEPVYSVVNKASKKPTPLTRADSKESPGGGGGPRPPRPPPLETIPVGEQDSPAQISVQQKPSRPVAPPTIRRKLTDSNLSHDGRDDTLSSPPKGPPKPKARSKSETTKF
ncbi:uncharacterized protein [Diadema antillarum]|uniref:uncharacterized protein n=1 Tax=Diadema antillarum TaxID=105358 RepID=UPI003A860F4C